MGIPAARAHGSVRFSLCRETTKAELETATAIVTDVVARLRSTMTAV
jgi:cysteine desulfurase